MNRTFDSFVASLPVAHWAKYDLAAVKLGWEAQEGYIKELEDKLSKVPVHAVAHNPLPGN